MKKNFDNAISLCSVTEEELALINKYSLTELKADDIFAFNVVLCDNEIDRDLECFDMQSLKTLSELYIGKTGILNHEMKAENQIARIYHTEIEVIETQKTSAGETYARLKARAYMLKNQKNMPLIDEICAGIKKEVSINCAVSEIVCSVCGKNMKKERCDHRKGKNCYHILKNPTDAYEWSFVAVPAQKNAGTVKKFSKENASAEIENLTLIAEKYKNFLRQEIVKLSAAISPQLSVKSIENICSSLDIDALENLRKDYLQAEKSTFRPQLSIKENESSIDGFKI
ncbi:MAG: hypothetical protein E7536_08830 [Ruminococcaceae bacterium]|nr:hypothetical protein [Oscillospiraceae bacterium]